jgi:hypothetical protein
MRYRRLVDACERGRNRVEFQRRRGFQRRQWDERQQWDQRQLGQ